VLPALLWIAFLLIPQQALDAARKRAEDEPLRLERRLVAAGVFLLLWLLFFEATAALLVEHWQPARDHAATIYVLATVCFLIFAAAGILSESAEARAAVRRTLPCWGRVVPPSEPLLPTAQR
jgi:di/tricarboxylate transporter